MFLASRVYLGGMASEGATVTPDADELGPLLARVMAGDGQAFNELLAQLRPFLHALVRRPLGAAPGPIDPSALVQSSLRRIFENFDAIRDDPTVPHLLAWVRTIVRNRVYDELRRRGREPGGRPSPDVID